MSKLSDQQRKDLLAAMEQPDETIDLSDIPEIREIPPGAVRGKFFRPGTRARMPVYLNPDIEEQLSASASRKGLTLSDLVNDLLAREIAIAEAIRH